MRHKSGKTGCKVMRLGKENLHLVKITSEYAVIQVLHIGPFIAPFRQVIPHRTLYRVSERYRDAGLMCAPGPAGHETRTMTLSRTGVSSQIPNQHRL